MNTAIELLREARNKWLKHQHSCNAWMSFNKCDCGLDDFFARIDAYLASPEPSTEEVTIKREHLQDALNYIKHCGANAVMRGQPHPQQQIVDWLSSALDLTKIEKEKP